MNDLTFISCVRFSLQLMIAEGILVFHMEKRKNFIIRLILSEICFFTAAFVIFHLLKMIPQNLIIVEIFYYFSLFAATLLLIKQCFDIGEKELLFVGTGGYAIQHFAFSFVQIIRYLIHIESNSILGNMCIYVIPYLVFPFILYCLVIRNHNNDGELKEKDIKMILLAFITIFITVVISLMARKENVNASEYMQMFISSIYSMVCCILTLVILFYIPKGNKLYHERIMLEQIIHVMGEQQKLSKESIEIINRKCHDIKHQIRVLTEMNNVNERKKFTEEINKEISIYDTIYQTGNATLDFILREKSLLCQEYHIKFSCITDGKLLNFMDTLDICVLFGNALDNAIESVIKENDREKRLINMNITNKAQMLYIHIDNYCNEDIQFTDGIPATDKKDKEYHGFGVKSIYHIAEKYDGNVSIKKRNDRFILDILFPI